MKKAWRFIVVFLLVLFSFQLLMSFRKEDKNASEHIRLDLVQQLEQFSNYVKDTFTILIEKGAPESQLQQAFLTTRLYYKSVEWAAEYFTYSTAKTINGAPKSEIDIVSQTISSPNGLQVIEEILFPHYDSSRKKDLENEVHLLADNIGLLQAYFHNIEIQDWQILDACKLEVFRVETLGLTGFDNALTLKSMQESAVALHSLRNVMKCYEEEDNVGDILFSQANRYLVSNTDFIQFNRAYFIKQFANPLSRLIELTRRKYEKSALQYNRLLRQDALTLFDSGAFNPDAYSPILDSKNRSEKIALGKAFFNDKSLSGTQTRSCASCHIEEKSFANNLIKEKSIDGKGLIDRNTPTLINTALQPQQFYDQRSENIEDQVVDVIHNPKEMKGSITFMLTAIKSNRKIDSLAKKAYPDKGVLGQDDVVESLSLYVRSLVKLNSRFDSYMQGEDNAMTTTEIDGFNLFMGKAQCGTCHYMPLFNGVFPPKYITQDVEVLGVPSSATSKELDQDRGIWNVLQKQGMYDLLLLEEFDHGFKTVSVRNVTKTAPYMHNGAFATLEELMDFYNEGGGVGKGLNVPNQSLSSNKLNLTPKEIADIIAFMHALESR
ncbi:MAG: cytochrome C peroxidase [Pseudopedobacter saltans]|uniref:Cytochrome C peroxidase n=1 Tax=Pseudopedobacter saltans TaxID=151895 RepID=A0A2W5H2M9_9SPHI|nr:MAG: cytochrome C peroxidase [Pseudopedobacter saltans]